MLFARLGELNMYKPVLKAAAEKTEDRNLCGARPFQNSIVDLAVCDIDINCKRADGTIVKPSIIVSCDTATREIVGQFFCDGSITEADAVAALEQIIENQMKRGARVFKLYAQVQPEFFSERFRCVCQKHGIQAFIYPPLEEQKSVSYLRGLRNYLECSFGSKTVGFDDFIDVVNSYPV